MRQTDSLSTFCYGAEFSGGADCPHSSGERATASGAVSVGSNPTGGATDHQAKHRLTWRNNKDRAAARVQPCAAKSRPMSGFPEYTRNEDHDIQPAQTGKTRSPGTPAGA